MCLSAVADYEAKGQGMTPLCQPWSTTEAFTGAIKLTTSRQIDQSWPTFNGSYKEFYAFRREYDLPLGNRTDIGDAMRRP
jgi:hypothetical protein